MPRTVPPCRVRAANEQPVREGGAHVLLWVTAARRTRWNFALDRALERAREFDRPLLVLEALRADYPFASDRHHAFVLRGMADNAARWERAGIAYHPYVEPARGAGRGLLAALARDACAVVTDDWPCGFHPRMLAAAARRCPVLLEAVDGCGLVPVRAPPRAYPTAFAFRRWLQHHLPEHAAHRPAPDPLSRVGTRAPARVPREVTTRWPRATKALLDADPRALAGLPIDHGVPPVAEPGGPVAGERRLRAFVRDRLGAYAERRNDPDAGATSGLSPYLHFGHVSPHEVVARVLAREGRDPDELVAGGDGRRGRWWGVSDSAEAFLEQVVTWRELAWNACVRDPAGYDRYEGLPAWARASLEAHEGDERRPRYGLATLEAARTHDPVWNAAQRELLGEGRIHGYLRMLWAKKVLEWADSPREAARILVRLNDRWASDGRDPNSYEGIFWSLGRHDRPWAPRRRVFGLVRYMSSESARRKIAMDAYLVRHGPADGEGGGVGATRGAARRGARAAPRARGSRSEAP